MKRWILYGVILALVVAAPAKPVNISSLIPVRAVGIYQEGSWFRVETDTGDKGYGGTVIQALENMHDTASGRICLDTAEFLLLTKQTQAQIPELSDQLPDSVRLCLTAAEMNLEAAAEYLAVHRGLPSLRTWKHGRELPVISTFGENIIFLKKVEKRA